MRNITIIIALVTLATTCILQTSCATASGFGRDLQSMGRELERAASQ